MGPYANDAWRIFCKDHLYGRVNPAEAEWKRVTPSDKQLAAYLKWRWEEESKRNDVQTPEEDIFVGQLTTEIDSLTM